MIRIARLLAKSKPLRISRGGGGWDRPDVPPTVNVPLNKLSLEQIMLTFHDNSQPEYILTSPQVANGDLLEALPTFTKLWAVFLGTALAIGIGFTLIVPSRDLPITNEICFYQNYKQIKQFVDTKAYIKYAINNPFGIQVNAEQYPPNTGGKVTMPEFILRQKQTVQYYKKINQQSSAYIQKKINEIKKKSSEGHTNDHHHSH